MKFVMAAIVFAVMLVASSDTPFGFATVTQTQAQSFNEALFRQCRKAVFRKYGYYRADGKKGRRYMSARDAIRFTDICVANGGRVP
jgi:hypothetical protein